MSGPGFIAEERPMVCSMCGAFEETRPYGPGGSRLCFGCAMKDEKQAERQFALQVLGEKVEESKP